MSNIAKTIDVLLKKYGHEVSSYCKPPISLLNGLKLSDVLSFSFKDKSGKFQPEIQFTDDRCLKLSQEDLNNSRREAEKFVAYIFYHLNKATKNG